MKAVVCRDGKLAVEERAEPVPGPGQVLVKVLRCGICGSDLHVRKHCNHWGDVMARSGYHALTRSDQPVVFGHEFSAEVLEYGPGCTGKLKPGTPVVAVPVLRRGKNIDLIGLSAHIDGGFAERMLLQEAMTMPVPNGLPPEMAALTEPMAVAWRALGMGQVQPRDVAVVIGCGPVGLSLICLLRARSVRTIVASDFSEGRRALARACGAHVVVDPAVDSPYERWGEQPFVRDVAAVLELTVSTSEKLRRLPLPWWFAWRMIEKLVGDPKGPVVFECVGAPGVLQGIIEGIPPFARIVVVGVCMQIDHIEGALATNKVANIRYAAGYSPLEFRDTLHAIADGKVRCQPLVTGEVGLEGVAEAFEVLGAAQHHAKVLVDPQRFASDLR